MADKYKVKALHRFRVEIIRNGKPAGHTDVDASCAEEAEVIAASGIPDADVERATFNPMNIP